jgi:two-component system OmpR family sensor kinase
MPQIRTRPFLPRRPRRLADALVLDLILAIGAVVLLCLAGTAIFLMQQINHNFDEELVESAHRLMDVAMHQIERDLGSPPQAPAQPLLGDPPIYRASPLIAQVVDAPGRVWLRTQAAPIAAFEVPRTEGFHDHEGWRIYVAQHPTLPLYLYLADPLAERTEAVASAMGWLSGLWALMLIVLTALLVWLARRRLGVLSQVQQQISTRSGTQLTPLPTTGLPAELAALVGDVNALLARLHEALQVERALAANAAHELRTPLAAAQLRLAAALADGLANPHVAAAHSALATLQHRTEKLLQLSRAESAQALNLQALNLNDIATSVAQEAWGQWPAAQRQLDLALAEGETPIALAEPDALAIALRNLIENALRYSGGADITLAVQAPSTLLVRDSGPGVPPERLASLRERHVRASADRTGFGLGLSIVASVAAKQGAQLVLQSPPDGQTQGFEARLVLRDEKADASG